MKKLLILVFVLLLQASKVCAIETKDLTHIYLNLTTKQVCSNRVNKCWEVATGNKTHPTPIGGPYYVLTKYTEGFNWRNPFTGQIYKKGTHNLGNIWIGITTINNIELGFHTTPNFLVPLNLQESLGGCVRMNAKDIKEFVATVNYLDEIYIVK